MTETSPYLWFRPEKIDSLGRKIHAAWMILDGRRGINTRCDLLEQPLAETRLSLYAVGEWPPKSKIQEESRQECVYFVTCNFPDFPIKIGTAVDVEIRLRAIQNGLPWPLQTLLLLRGYREKEREFHERFADLRMRGEWFARGPALWNYIETMKAASKVAA